MDPPASHRVSVRCGTQATPLHASKSLRDSHPLRSRFPARSIPFGVIVGRPTTPEALVLRFGLLRVRSPLLAESSLFLRVLRCFSSPGSLRSKAILALRRVGFPIRKSSAGHACTRLTDAFRSVPRPSSALDAQASPVCLAWFSPGSTEKLNLSSAPPASPDAATHRCLFYFTRSQFTRYSLVKLPGLRNEVPCASWSWGGLPPE